MNARRYDLVSIVGIAGTLLFIACLYLSPADLIPDIAVIHPALLSATIMLGAAMVVGRLLAGRDIRFAGGIGVAMAALFAFGGLSALWAYDSGSGHRILSGGPSSWDAGVAVGIALMLRTPRAIRAAAPRRHRGSRWSRAGAT